MERRNPLSRRGMVLIDPLSSLAAKVHSYVMKARGCKAAEIVQSKDEESHFFA